MSLFSKISSYIYHVDYHHLEHECEIRLNLNREKKFNLNKEKEQKKSSLNFHTIFTLFTLIKRHRRNIIFIFLLIRDFVSLALAIRSRSFLDRLDFLSTKSRSTNFLSFFFFFVFSFVAIAFSASVLIFVTSTKFEVSSWSDRWSFIFSSFISSTKRDQSRCVR